MKRNNIEEEIDILLETKANVTSADGTNKRKGFGMSKRTFKGMACGLGLMLIISFVGVGALLGWFSATTVDADVEDLLLFDGVACENLQTSWNIGDVVGGNLYCQSHNLSLSDLRQDPLNVSFVVIDDEENGANIQVLNSALEEITYLELDPDETQEIFYKITFDDYTNMTSFSGSITIL